MMVSVRVTTNVSHTRALAHAIRVNISSLGEHLIHLLLQLISKGLSIDFGEGSLMRS